MIVKKMKEYDYISGLKLDSQTTYKKEYVNKDINERKKRHFLPKMIFK